MEIELNTNLIQMINVNSYTNICYNETFDIFNWTIEGYNKIIMEIVPPILEDMYREIFKCDIEIKPIMVYNPKYYNYERDEFYYILKFDKREYNKLFKQVTNDNNFWKFLKDNYSSYDGFISYMANNKNDFYNQEFYKQFASIIQYLWDNIIKDNNILDKYICRYYEELLDSFYATFDLEEDIEEV